MLFLSIHRRFNCRHAERRDGLFRSAHWAIPGLVIQLIQSAARPSGGEYTGIPL